MQNTSVPYIFSPNFDYQIDFRITSGEFLIRHTHNQQIYMKIRNDLISTEWFRKSGEKAILLILSRFKWISDKRIRFIN